MWKAPTDSLLKNNLCLITKKITLHFPSREKQLSDSAGCKEQPGATSRYCSTLLPPSPGQALGSNNLYLHHPHFGTRWAQRDSHHVSHLLQILPDRTQSYFIPVNLLRDNTNNGRNPVQQGDNTDIIHHRLFTPLLISLQGNVEAPLRIQIGQ